MYKKLLFNPCINVFTLNLQKTYPIALLYMMSLLFCIFSMTAQTYQACTVYKSRGRIISNFEFTIRLIDIAFLSGGAGKYELRFIINNYNCLCLQHCDNIITFKFLNCPDLLYNNVPMSKLFK